MRFPFRMLRIVDASTDVSRSGGESALPEDEWSLMSGWMSPLLRDACGPRSFRCGACSIVFVDFSSRPDAESVRCIVGCVQPHGFCAQTSARKVHAQI